MKSSKSLLKITLVVISLFVSNEKICIAQWQWMWPLPQGMNLNSVSFINENSGIFVGERGVILRTTNAGVNYSILNIGFNYNLNTCSFVNSDLCFAGGDFSRIYRSTNSGLNWSYTSIESGINNLFFINENTGWASALNNSMFKTTNSGITWSHSSLPYLNTVNTIFFLNQSTGFAAGNSSGHVKMIKTIDGGITWSRVNYLYPEAINSIYFLDSLIGLAGCTGGVLVKTSDGGISWTQLATTFNSGNFNSIRFNGETGFIILDIDNIQILLRSSDSGMNWAETYSDTLVKLTSINITGPNVFVTGTNGRILKSFDNGINWLSNKGNVQRGFSYIKFLNENTGIAADWGSNYPTFKMYGTTTGGQNWFVRGNVTNVNSIFSIEFVDMNTGYMVGGNSNLYAKIYKTTNCGVVWNELAFPANETIADVDFINAETGIVCGGGGLIARTTNGALSWEVTNRGGPDWNGAICFADLSNCFSANSAGTIYKSSNAGASWIIASTVGTSIDEINFVNSLTGFIAASNGVYRTTDGGYSWTNISGAGTYHDLKFYDSNTGFVSAYNGRLARTTNSGQSWIDESYISPGLNYNSFCFINSEVVYMLGSNNLFKTTNGGVLTNYIGSESQTAQSFRLFQNYPNPFNPSTKIMYEIPRSSFVSIKVFDNLGKELKELVYEFKRQGIFEVTFDGNNLPSGIYYCRLECFDQNKSSNSLIQVQKMILIK